LKKNQDNLIANRKWTSCYNNNIWNRLCYFHWTLHERGQFCSYQWNI